MPFLERRACPSPAGSRPCAMSLPLPARTSTPPLSSGGPRSDGARVGLTSRAPSGSSHRPGATCFVAEWEEEEKRDENETGRRFLLDSVRVNFGSIDRLPKFHPSPGPFSTSRSPLLSLPPLRAGTMSHGTLERDQGRRPAERPLFAAARFRIRDAGMSGLVPDAHIAHGPTQYVYAHPHFTEHRISAHMWC